MNQYDQMLVWCLTPVSLWEECRQPAEYFPHQWLLSLQLAFFIHSVSLNFNLAWAHLKFAKVQEVCLPWSSASSRPLFLFLSLCNQHRLLQEIFLWVNLTKTCPSHVNNNNNDDDSDNKSINNDKYYCYYYKIIINILYNFVIVIIIELNNNCIINKYFSIEIIFQYFMY